jgi:hypothetical protein
MYIEICGCFVCFATENANLIELPRKKPTGGF